MRAPFLPSLLLLAALGCGCGAEPEPAAVVPAATDPAGPGYREEGRALALHPGADVSPGLPEQVERAAPPPEGAALQLELGADRPALKLPVPRLRRASTARFALGAGRRGWITRLASGASLPSVAFGDQRVFVSGGFDARSFYALEASTGRVIWDRQNLEDNGPAAPIYQDGELIFNTESCTLFVLDARTGRTRWKRWLGDPTLAQAAVQHGLVYASYPVDGGQRLGALRLRDGRMIWSRPVDGELLSAPVVAADSVFVSSVRGTTYRFTAREGRLRWSRRLRATSAPFIDGGRVFLSRQLSSGTEALIALDLESGRTRAVLQRSQGRYLGDVPRDLQSWPKVWAFEGSRPLLAGGRLLDSSAGVVRALQPDSGRLLWSRREPKQVGRRVFSPPVVGGSQLVLSARGGQVYALDVDTGMTVWAYDVGRPLAASPVVARGWIYLSTRDGSVIGLEVGGPDLDGWHMWGGSPGHNGPAAPAAGSVSSAEVRSPPPSRPTTSCLLEAPPAATAAPAARSCPLPPPRATIDPCCT